MAKMTPRTLSGFMELLPAPQQQMERIMEILRRTYSLYGFTPLDTPVIESSEVLLAKGGGETEKQIYRFQKGDADLSLRFDLTVPLAKYVALHYNDLSFPFRRYQIGKVYRGERAQRGRFREFYQADIDIIGDGKLSITNEAEIPAIIYKTFSTLGLKRFQIRVNDRKILNGFYAMLGLTEKSGDIMRTVDKLDKIGAEKVKALLIEETALTQAQADEILKFISISGSNEAVLEALSAYQGRNEVFDTGLSELNTVVKYLAAFGVPAENFAVDLTIARGLDYYTGTVYETTLLDYPEIGSVCSGGRYDDLAGFYTDRQLPGVGISIGLTRLFYVLGEQGLLNPELPTAPADVLSPAHDRGPLRRHLPGHPAAGKRHPHPAPLRGEEVQAEDDLRQQPPNPLCDLPGGGRRSAQAWWPARIWPPASRPSWTPPPPSTASKQVWRKRRRAPSSWDDCRGGPPTQAALFSPGAAPHG